MVEPVLVVGAGPVGLTMALELARYGVPVRLVDKMSARSDKSRAVALWSRTLELLDREDVTAELIARGNKVSAANIVSGQKLIARLDLARVQTPYPFLLLLPQNETETVLEQRLERYGVRSELGIELSAFTEDSQGIDATLRDANGRESSQRFSWLVACDGSHSPIRHDLGLSFDGDTIGTDWALGDFHMTGAPYPLNELPTYWHQDGALIFFPMAPGRYRVIASLGPSGATLPEPPTMQGFQAIVDRRGPGGIALTDPIWTSTFRINERQVDRYRVGRVFLAGDAAHVHSPAGGQGMNTGMQDAINLAWKLALVCRGLARGPHLLDSYDAERRPVGAEVIASAGHLTKLALLGNPIGKHVRDAVAHVMMGLPPVQHAIADTMTEIAVGYPKSPLNGPAHGGEQKPGGRMAPVAGEPPYGLGDSPRFTLRASVPAGTAVPQSLQRLVDPAIRRNLGDAMMLVRPDGYLALSAPHGDWPAVERYLARLTGP